MTVEEMKLHILPLHPDARGCEGRQGTPVVLSDKNCWLLYDGGLCNHLDAIRDKIYDQLRLHETVDMMDIANVAHELLVANYELAGPEAAALLFGVDNQILAAAVLEALFGPSQVRRTYTAWAASSLLINGIDPTRVPGKFLPHVLAQLEELGRCVPRETYIESAEASRKIKAWRGRVKPEPVPEPSATAEGREP
jgi:hypothetical protein